MSSQNRFLSLAFCIGMLMTGCQKQTLNPATEKTDSSFYVLKSIPYPINDAVVGYMSAVPREYLSSDKKYPMILWLHGSAQYGDGSDEKFSRLFWGGIPTVLGDRKFPDEFTVNSLSFSFIILSPQFRRAPLLTEVKLFMDYAIENYPVDTTRIYVSGLSAGGIITSDFAAAYGSKLAAIVPIAGESADDETLEDKCRAIAETGLPVWVFHNQGDQLVPMERAEKFVSTINKFNPAISPILTLFPASGPKNHDAWTRAVDPEFKSGGLSIYEWMLQYRSVRQQH